MPEAGIRSGLPHRLVCAASCRKACLPWRWSGWHTLALPHLAGAVLAGYGAGNVPDALAPHLLAAAGRGVVLATVTQAWQGAVAMGAYAASQALVAAGVVPLADMTPEAALTRLTVLLATETDPQRVRQQLAGGRPGEWSNAPA